MSVYKLRSWNFVSLLLQIEYVLGRTKLLLIFRCFVQGKDRCGSKTEKLGDERFGSAFSHLFLGSRPWLWFCSPFQTFPNMSCFVNQRQLQIWTYYNYILHYKLLITNCGHNDKNFNIDRPEQNSFPRWHIPQMFRLSALGIEIKWLAS